MPCWLSIRHSRRLHLLIEGRWDFMHAAAATLPPFRYRLATRSSTAKGETAKELALHR
jgi:hypothetical protein